MKITPTDFLNKNIKIYINTSWETYDRIKKLVGGFHYSSSIRFYDDKNNFLEIKTNSHSSIAFPFYRGSDPKKSYKYVFENKSFDMSFPFFIYDEYLSFLKEKIKQKYAILNLEKNIILDINDINLTKQS